jgi:arsenite methyltransferase
MAQLVFDDETGKQLEELYRLRDAVRRRRLVREALAARRGERILDVGCGPGFYCAELIEEVGPEGSIVGIDTSPQMLSLARRRCPGAELHEGDATALPVEDGRLDAALSVQVLEYVEDATAALVELYRALRPGGRVLVWDVDWATVSWHSADPVRMDRVLAAWDEHLAHPSLPRTLVPRMRSVGFDRIEVEGHSFATADFDPDSYGPSIIPVIESFVGGDEAEAWAAEQRQLGEHGDFFFACIQFCFTARRPGG